ncbi:MAG: hypothetical protein K0V04_10850 [Deltaproteobacteria bacterium]|nr:hypothetical protein [Deltaproteobacteria bacterium]
MTPARATVLATFICGCTPAPESDDAPDPTVAALQAATEQMEVARTAFEAEREETKAALAELREAQTKMAATLDALAAKRARPALPSEIPPRSSRRLGEDELEDALAGIKCASMEHCTIERSYLDTLMANPALLSRQARVVPSQRDGVTRGYKLYGIRRDSLPKLLHIKNGDMLTKINGKNLTSIDEAMAGFGELRTATKLEIELERKGEMITRTIEITGG